MHESTDTAAAAATIAVGAWGWQHPEWLQTYYPDDLPEEWRLSYYSNEFPVVLVPARDWRAASAATVAQWCEDVHGGFRFYLEVTVDALAVHGRSARASNPESSLERLDMLCDAFGEALAGLIVRCSDAVDMENVLARVAALPQVPTITLAGSPVWLRRPQLPERLADRAIRLALPLAGEVAAEVYAAQQSQVLLLPDGAGQAVALRQLRAAIERCLRLTAPGQTSTLIFDGPTPRIEDMRNAVVIAELLDV